MSRSQNISGNNQGGFVLTELMVVSGILAVLLSLTLTSINPNKQFAASRNAERTANVTAILDAVYEYEASNGGKEPSALASVSTTPRLLGKNVFGAVDLCSDLVPTYLASLPTDPVSATISGGTSACAPETAAYNSGYTISQGDDGRLTISATSEDGLGAISVTR